MNDKELEEFVRSWLEMVINDQAGLQKMRVYRSIGEYVASAEEARAGDTLRAVWTLYPTTMMLFHGVPRADLGDSVVNLNKLLRTRGFSASHNGDTNRTTRLRIVRGDVL
jgi:hypothetical protein